MKIRLEENAFTTKEEIVKKSTKVERERGEWLGADVMCVKPFELKFDREPLENSFKR